MADRQAAGCRAHAAGDPAGRSVRAAPRSIASRTLRIELVAAVADAGPARPRARSSRAGPDARRACRPRSSGGRLRARRPSASPAGRRRASGGDSRARSATPDSVPRCLNTRLAVRFCRTHCEGLPTLTPCSVSERVGLAGAERLVGAAHVGEVAGREHAVDVARGARQPLQQLAEALRARRRRAGAARARRAEPAAPGRAPPDRRAGRASRRSARHRRGRRPRCPRPRTRVERD